MALKLRWIAARAWVSMVEASLLQMETADPRKRELTAEQAKCLHRPRDRVKRGNKFGSGTYCSQCKLRLQWESSRSEAPDVEKPTLKKKEQQAKAKATPKPTSRSASSCPKSSVKLGTFKVPTPAISQDCRTYANMDQQAHEVDQNPSQEQTGTVMVNFQKHQIVCKCLLPLRRWQAKTNRTGRMGEYFWRCPLWTRGCQCDVMIWEVDVDKWAACFPATLQPHPDAQVEEEEEEEGDYPPETSWPEAEVFPDAEEDGFWVPEGVEHHHYGNA